MTRLATEQQLAFPTIKTEGGTTNAVIAPNLPQFARGVNALLEVEFFDDAPTNSIPAVPGNPAQYPAFAIVGPDGVTVTTGVGIAGAAPGRWQTTWSVPTSAALSTQANKWRVVWNMVTATARQLQITNPFDVVELRTPETLENLRSRGYIVYAGTPETVVLQLPTQPFSLSVTGFAPTNLNNPTPQTAPAFSGTLAGGQVLEVPEQNLFSYTFTTAALNTYGSYQIVWTYRLTPSSPTTTVVQSLHVPPPVFWALADSLKTLIDKLRKKLGAIQAYDESELFEYFQRGLGILNGVTPVTNFDLLTFPYNAYTVRFLIEAAALWAMQAQHLVAGELQFSWSGQTITLDLDQTGTYQDVIQRLLDDLGGDGKAAWPAAKVGLARTLGPIAHVGNRMMGGRQYNFVYKVTSSQIGSASPTLSVGSTIPGFGFSLTDVIVYLNLT